MVHPEGCRCFFSNHRIPVKYGQVQRNKEETMATIPTASPYSTDSLWGEGPEKDTAPLPYIATPEHEAWVRGLIREELEKREKGAP